MHNQLIPSLHQCTLQNISTADLSLFPSVCTVPSFAHFFANLRHRRTFRSRNFSLRSLFFFLGGVVFQSTLSLILTAETAAFPSFASLEA